MVEILGTTAAPLRSPCPVVVSDGQVVVVVGLDVGVGVVVVSFRPNAQQLLGGSVQTCRLEGCHMGPGSVPRAL